MQKLLIVVFSILKIFKKSLYSLVKNIIIFIK